MRIAVFGTGAVGGYYGGRLAQAGEDVYFIARGENLRALKENGLRVDSTKGDFHICPVNATDKPQEIGPVDVVLVATKTWQLAEAIESMRPMMAPGTLVVSTLNGVEAPGQLDAGLGPGHAAGGLVKLFTALAAPGYVIHSGGPADFKFGRPAGPAAEQADRLLAALLRAGVDAAIPADIHSALWEKFLFITTFASVGAVTRAPIGVLRSQPETRRLLRQSMEEIREVGAAHGARFDADVIERYLAFMDGQPAGGFASMQRDILNGRRSELDALTGAVVRLGKTANVPTPLYETFYAALLPQELKARGEILF